MNCWQASNAGPTHFAKQIRNSADHRYGKDSGLVRVVRVLKYVLDLLFDVLEMRAHRSVQDESENGKKMLNLMYAVSYTHLTLPTILRV